MSDTNDPRMTPEQAQEAVDRATTSMASDGWWNKVCVHCGRSVGGRLAAYGKPTPEELRYVCCPVCDVIGDGDQDAYNGADHVRIEFVPGTRTN